MSDGSVKKRKPRHLPPVETRFGPGNNANPSGRPKSSQQALMHAHRIAVAATPEAIQFHIDRMRDVKERVELRQKSADSILDRGGLVRGFVLSGGDDRGPLADATPAEAILVYEEILATVRAREAARALPDVTAAPEPQPRTAEAPADPEKEPAGG